MSSARKRTGHLQSLTAIRFVAAFWVMLNHYVDEISLYAPALTPFLLHGASGVSLFFVLSGFILTHVYWERDLRGKAGGDYAVHRFARIYPMYAVSILILLPRLALDRSQPIVQFAFDHPWLVGLSHLTLTHNWFFHPSAVFNGPTWSVGCEIGFYLLFPSLLSVVRRVRLRQAMIGMVVLTVVAAIFPVMYAKGIFPGMAERYGWEYGFNIDQRLNHAIRMWPIFRLPEFLIGMLVAVVVRRKPVWDTVEKVLLGGLLFASAFLFWTLGQDASLTRALIVQQVAPVPFFAVGLLALALAKGERPRFLAAPLLVMLGEASYSLYLLHVPVKHGLTFFEQKVGIDPTQPAMIVASLVITILVSLLAFRYIEAPARRWIIRHYESRRPVVSAMA